ncbi:MAG: FAD-dependent monooxygenase [Burkholderiaceae bacterium]
MPAMARTLDVCIRGGGIVGHVLALLLARERLRVALVVSPPAATADVRAYALNRRSRSLLEQLRCWPPSPDATAVARMEVQETGGASVQFDAGELAVDALAWIVDVPVLEAQLAQAVRFQPQIEILDAPREDARLTVVCEGRASASRAQFGVEQEVTRYPQWAIATRLACELPHRQVACQWFTPNDILGLLPMRGESGNLVAAVWSIPSESKDELLEMPVEMFEHRIQAACEGRFGRMQLAGGRAAWPLQRVMAQRWSGQHAGRAWVLAGDAAHAVHPLAGQGLNLGLADAHALATALHGRAYWRGVDDARVLRRYERSRKADVAVMAAATDGLQQLFGRAGGPWQSLRHWGMRGFDGSGLLKRWVARQAMGQADDSASDNHNGPSGPLSLTGPA